MTTVIQHPYGESDQDMVESEYSQGSDGYLGYIGYAKMLFFILIRLTHLITLRFFSPIGMKSSVGQSVTDGTSMEMSTEVNSENDYAYTFEVNGLTSGSEYKFQVQCISTDGDESEKFEDSFQTNLITDNESGSTANDDQGVDDSVGLPASNEASATDTTNDEPANDEERDGMESSEAETPSSANIKNLCSSFCVPLLLFTVGLVLA